MDSSTKAQIQKHLQSLKSAVLYLELCLQDGADHKQLNLASKGIVLSAAFMDTDSQVDGAGTVTANRQK